MKENKFKVVVDVERINNRSYVYVNTDESSNLTIVDMMNVLCAATSCLIKAAHNAGIEKDYKLLKAAVSFLEHEFASTTNFADAAITKTGKTIKAKKNEKENGQKKILKKGSKPKVLRGDKNKKPEAKRKKEQ